MNRILKGSTVAFPAYPARAGGVSARRRSLHADGPVRFGHRNGTNRRWRRIWIGLLVVWTMLIAAICWINLPRAENVPHDPAFLTQLPDKLSSLVLQGETDYSHPHREGALLWFSTTTSVPMKNGTVLRFPSGITTELIMQAKAEYTKVLESRARALSGPYVLSMIITWLLPCPVLLFLALATRWMARQRGIDVVKYPLRMAPAGPTMNRRSAPDVPHGALLDGAIGGAAAPIDIFRRAGERSVQWNRERTLRRPRRYRAAAVMQP